MFTNIFLARLSVHLSMNLVNEMKFTLEAIKYVFIQFDWAHWDDIFVHRSKITDKDRTFTI